MRLLRLLLSSCKDGDTGKRLAEEDHQEDSASAFGEAKTTAGKTGAASSPSAGSWDATPLNEVDALAKRAAKKQRQKERKEAEKAAARLTTIKEVVATDTRFIPDPSMEVVFPICRCDRCGHADKWVRMENIKEADAVRKPHFFRSVTVDPKFYKLFLGCKSRLHLHVSFYLRCLFQ